MFCVPTTRNIHSFPLLQKIQLVMCCIRLVDSVTFSGSPVYDDDIIEDVCENMGTIMFQLGTVLCNGLCQGEPPQRPKKEERGPYGNGSMHELRLLSVVQTRGE